MVLDRLFKIAVAKGASDLHLVVGEPPILRVDGNLIEIDREPELDQKTAEKIIFEILTENQKEKLINTRELDLSCQIDDGSRFRVNLFWEKDNLGLVARVISKIIPTLEDLLIPPVVIEMTRAKQGLILVTGPTGCGKSTTLAAMLNLLNHEIKANIITLEDPIEFVYEPDKCIIRQRQLGSDMLTFGSALKHVLRQDPNVIMVGEMRDLETIATTITLAETGHLVLATLHTHNAGQTIDRIVDVFPPYQQPQIRLQLSMSLNGVISQHLLPGKDGGRVAVREILVNTPAVANIIRENKIPQIKTAIQTSSEEGMVTMEQDLKRLLDEGHISKEIYEKYKVLLV
jgi:twitching motility protein PilT